MPVYITVLFASIVTCGAIAIASTPLRRWQSYCGWTGLAALVISLVQPSPSSSTIIYFASCSDLTMTFADCQRQGGSLIAGRPQIFQLDAVAGTVVRHGGPFGERTYRNCNIADRFNWDCPITENNRWLEVANGRYANISRSEDGEFTERCRRFSKSHGQISKEYWSYLRLVRLVTNDIVPTLRTLLAGAGRDRE